MNRRICAKPETTTLLNQGILKQRQSLPLEAKIAMSIKRIREWHEHWNGDVYVSFSGGKDSTVLLHLVRSIYPHVKAVFFNTGIEFPEIRTFIQQTENVEWIMPKMSFYEVIKKYGYPVVSKENSQKISEARTTKSEKLLHLRLYGRGDKYNSGRIPLKWQYLINAPFNISHKCCDVMKKDPAKQFEKKSGMKCILGTMASDSHLRRQQYLRNGCNSYEGKQQCKPLSFWLTEDIWEYIKKYNLKYSPIYDLGYKTTGCIYCAFGAHLEKEPNRFQLMGKTHPHLWKYCMDKLGMRKVLEVIGVPHTLPERRGL